MTLDLLFLAPPPSVAAGVRFRVLPYVELARAQGLDADVRLVPRGPHRRLAFLAALPRARVMVIHKELFSRPGLARIRRRADVLAFDFDEALWTVPPSVPQGPGRAKLEARAARRFKRQCERVDLLVAGNAFLAARGRNHNVNAAILPTGIDPTVFTPPVERPRRERVVAGWMGTAGSLWFLEKAVPDLAQLADRVELRAVSDAPYAGQLADLVASEPWDEAREVAQLQDFDLGLLPLENDQHTRGKCGLKGLQYMACGAVPVASAVGYNRELVRHGEDGFLVERPGQWAEFVGLLADDEDLRRRMAEAGRAKVEDRYDVRNQGWRLLDMLGLGAP